MSEIRLVACLCPKRHAIMGFCYDAAQLAPADAVKQLEALVERAIAAGKLNRKCLVCGFADTVFHYEDDRSIFQTIQEAQAAAPQINAQQRTRAMFIRAGRN